MAKVMNFVSQVHRLDYYLNRSDSRLTADPSDMLLDDLDEELNDMPAYLWRHDVEYEDLCISLFSSSENNLEDCLIRIFEV